MAFLAASLMCSGVVKSGSPRLNLITSKPSASNWRALAAISSVCDSLSDTIRVASTGFICVAFMAVQGGGKFGSKLRRFLEVASLPTGAKTEESTSPEAKYSLFFSFWNNAIPRSSRRSRRYAKHWD